MVLGRAYQPTQSRPMDLAWHHLETIWQKKTTRETSQAVERRPRQILERHDMAEDSTRLGNLETACWGLRPTTGHNGCCLIMMTMMNGTPDAGRIRRIIYFGIQYIHMCVCEHSSLYSKITFLKARYYVWHVTTTSTPLKPSLNQMNWGL